IISDETKEELWSTEAMPKNVFLKPDILLGVSDIEHLELAFVSKLPSGYLFYESTIGPLVTGNPKPSNGKTLNTLALIDQTFPSAKNKPALQDVIETSHNRYFKTVEGKRGLKRMIKLEDRIESSKKRAMMESIDISKIKISTRTVETDPSKSRYTPASSGLNIEKVKETSKRKVDNREANNLEGDRCLNDYSKESNGQHVSRVGVYREQLPTIVGKIGSEQTAEKSKAMTNLSTNDCAPN
ncbi:MAG TPA: hypothetical protein VFV08_10920, partial [Puia sp.]|nr:hypothetical protein [Puia sp.]